MHLQYFFWRKRVALPGRLPPVLLFFFFDQQSFPPSLALGSRLEFIPFPGFFGLTNTCTLIRSLFLHIAPILSQILSALTPNFPDVAHFFLTCDTSFSPPSLFILFFDFFFRFPSLSPALAPPSQFFSFLL